MEPATSTSTSITNKKPPKRRLEKEDEQAAADSAAVDMMEPAQQADAEPPTLAPGPTGTQQHPCNAPGCRLAFGSPAQLEVHFRAAHQFECLECCPRPRAAFASQAILDRHIEEHHDPFFQVLVERGERLYKCLADGCAAGFGSGNARRLHCVAKHNFPHDFDFEGLLGAAAPAPAASRARGRGKGGGKEQGRPALLTEGEKEARAEAIRASGAVCRYYNTPGGCRRGEGCFFRHETTEGGKDAGGKDEDDGVERLGEALDRRLRLDHARGVSFGRQARGRSKRLGGRASGAVGGGMDVGGDEG